MNDDKIKILVGDDSLLVRKQISECLADMPNIEVLQASDGQETVDLYKKFRPNIVLLDIIMPVKTGIVALQEIIEFDPKAKVVIISSIGTNKNLKFALENGAVDFFQKPLDKSNLLYIIDRVKKEVN